MKRFASFVIMLAIVVGLLPAASAASAAEPGRSWEEVARQCEDLGLEITWYPEYEGLMRRYGTDRMLLVQGGKSYLYSLRGDQRLAGPFDAFDYFNGSGLAPACQNWKWGVVDLDGETVVDFTYATQEEAAVPIAHFVSRWADGSAPYALADAEGKLLTEYKYWQYRPFSWGLAAVTDGASWGYVDQRGSEVVPCRYGEAYDFQSNGRARVYYYEGRRSNFIDGTGREMLEAPSVYTSLWDAGQGLWGLGVSGGAEFYNDQGELVLQVPCSFKSDPKGKMIGNVFDRTGTASFYSEDGTRKEVTIPIGEDGLHEGLYRVQDPDSGLWGFENGEKEPVVPAVFDTAGYFDHGVAVVRSGDTFGLLENPLNKKNAKPAENTPELPTSTFDDVPAGSWFEKGVMTCAQSGIMVGTGENTFSPNATLTDAECVMLAYRLYDKAQGGDGAVLKRPERYHYIKLTTDDGLFTHEGDGGDRNKWGTGHPVFAGGGLYLYPKNIEGPIPGLSLENNVAATVTVDGVEYKGHLKEFFQGHMQPVITAFVAETLEENDLVADAATTTETGYWWSDLGYTLEEKGLRDSLFPRYYLRDSEAGRYVFAELLGNAVELPKTLEIANIPDVGARSEEYEGTYTNEVWKLYEAGIIGGVDAYGTFDSAKTLTRAEAAVMVARVLDESQRLTTPPKPMPAEGEGYTLTYLRDGIVDSRFEQDTYPYYFVAELTTDPDGWENTRQVGFLKLDGSFMPWPESDVPFSLERFGGDTIYWTNIYKAQTDEELNRYEVGVLNDDLEWIIEPQYSNLWPREGGYAAVTEDERYLLLDEKGNVEKEVAGWEELPERPYWTGYYEYWTDWQNWGGLWVSNEYIGEQLYYRWPDGSPATGWFDWCGKIGPDGQGFVQKDGKIYRIQFTQP